MGNVGSETRSLGQILEKRCVGTGGHIFSQIIMKLIWNFCLEENTKMGKVGSKTRSLCQILEKHCVCSRDQIFGGLMKLIVFALMKSLTFLKMDHVGSKKKVTRSNQRRSYASNQGVLI